MKNTSHDIAAASAMRERARQILELTYQDWRLHERPQRRGKAAKVRRTPRYGITAVPSRDNAGAFAGYAASVSHDLAILARV